LTANRRLVSFSLANRNYVPKTSPSDSVICYGKARILEDLDERKVALNAFNRRFKPGAEDISMERVVNCCVVEIRITEMTGRQERERKRTCWRYTF
jgi:nitroimidazol reductase NimA-like FMN-containing flavoprotein (pyridoxamine 5'-phosphate oxidase superfamily)